MRLFYTSTRKLLAVSLLCLLIVLFPLTALAVPEASSADYQDDSGGSSLLVLTFTEDLTSTGSETCDAAWPAFVKWCYASSYFKSRNTTDTGFEAPNIGVLKSQITVQTLHGDNKLVVLFTDTGAYDNGTEFRPKILTGIGGLQSSQLFDTVTVSIAAVPEMGTWAMIFSLAVLFYIAYRSKDRLAFSSPRAA
jgi:hypothetical protein